MQPGRPVEWQALDPQLPADARGGEPHPKIARLIDHWHAIAPAPGLLPGRRHFDPMRVHDLMPHLWMVDVLPQPHPRFRVRLVGGGLVDAGAAIRRGHYIHEGVAPSEAEQVLRLFDRVVERRQLDWARGPSVFHYMQHVHSLERVILPMATDGTIVDLLLCMSLFYWTDGRIY